MSFSHYPPAIIKTVRAASVPKPRGIELCPNQRKITDFVLRFQLEQGSPKLVF